MASPAEPTPSLFQPRAAVEDSAAAEAVAVPVPVPVPALAVPALVLVVDGNPEKVLLRVSILPGA